MTHICVVKLTIIAPDNGLSPKRRQAIIWTNAGILLIGPLGTNVSEILIGIQTFSFKKMHLKMSSAKWRPFCLDLNVLTIQHKDWYTGAWRKWLLFRQPTYANVLIFKKNFFEVSMKQTNASSSKFCGQGHALFDFLEEFICITMTS